MTHLKWLALAAITVFPAGCSTNTGQRQSSLATDVIVPVTQAAAATTLLVSLDDGSIIKQFINVGADICFKQNSASATTCFSQGNAIVDPHTNEIVAYEMVEAHIELIAESN